MADERMRQLDDNLQKLYIELSARDSRAATYEDYAEVNRYARELLVALATERAKSERLAGALRELLAQCKEDFGDFDEFDGTVGSGENGDCAITYETLRTARAALSEKKVEG